MFATDQPQVKQVVAARIPTDVGEFQLYLFENSRDDKEHLALVYGEVRGREQVLVRVHSECFTGDVLGSRRCDCGEQLQNAMSRIAEAECGIILYLRQEGRGIGLGEKLKAYNLQDEGYDTVEANLLLGHGEDERDYGVAADMLRDLGAHSIQLITNNPAKIEELELLGIEITGRVPSVAELLTADNAAYLQTKITKMRHLLDLKTIQPLVRPTTPTPMGFVRQAIQQRPEKRPSVTLSYAQTLDGAITQQQGRPTIISGRASLTLTHDLRAAHQGILVGINTVLSDDPRLTVRLAEGDDPTPIVLDSGLRLPLDAKLIQPGRAVLVLTSEEAPAEKAAQLRALGVTVIPIAKDVQQKLSISDALQAVYERGIFSVMIEGGAHVIQSFLAAGLVDQAVITLSPKFMGGYHVVNGVPLYPAPQLHNLQQMILGEDIILWGKMAG